MAIVRIRVNGREYDVACDDGQEEELRILADDVDDRIRSLVFSMGSNPGEAMALMLTALTMADELVESKKQIEDLSLQVRRMATQAKTPEAQESRIDEIEQAMAETLEEIATRIEKIAAQVEVS